MILEHAGMLIVLAVVVGCLLAYTFVIWRKRQPPKPPEPTPWADSTRVAERVRNLPE